MEPEYFEEYKKVVNMGSSKQLTWSGKRGTLTNEYGWTIPTSNLIQTIKNSIGRETIYEIGAGNGYLSYELQKRGVNTHPVDISTPDNTWTEVHNNDYKNLNSSDIKHVLLAWPPANSPMGLNCVQYLEPSTIHFIGKENSVTGNNNFHSYMNKYYDVKNQLELPSWTHNSTVYKQYHLK